MAAIDLAHLRSWIGRSEKLDDAATAAPPRALTATLDRDDAPGAGAALPPCWHWRSCTVDAGSARSSWSPVSW